jgi:hypothetical protein
MEKDREYREEDSVLVAKEGGILQQTTVTCETNGWAQF